jgi:hypothetical protein
VLAVGDVEDLDEAPENEVEAAEEEILDQATAAATLAELKIEIATLGRLEALAYECRKQTAMDSTPSASSRSRATLALAAWSGAITAPAWLMRSPTSSCQRRGTLTRRARGCPGPSASSPEASCPDTPDTSAMVVLVGGGLDWPRRASSQGKVVPWTMRRLSRT